MDSDGQETIKNKREENQQQQTTCEPTTKERERECNRKGKEKGK